MPAQPALEWLSIMSHTYCCALFHCVFSTKQRQKTIPPAVRERLWAYLGGVARRRGMKALAVGGITDHVHILLSLPSSKAISEAIRNIKSESSRWMREEGGTPRFEWQEGYGAFSVGWTQIEATITYIARQEEHHKRRDYQAEFVAFLKKHEIAYDPRYIWG
jgi:putative transposase